MFNNHPVKLQDCRRHGAGAELFLVEGDSASLAVASLRNAQFQAVLPMQGKPLNAMKAAPAKVVENALLSALIEAVGAGWGDDFEVQKCRYGRILLLMDPDADGIHCGALMLMFFYRWMRPLLEQGNIAMVRPPVGEVLDTHSGECHYAFTEAQFMRLCAQYKNMATSQLTTQKYRGLAGISPAQLNRSCIDPATRKVSEMGLRDAQMAVEVFSAMG